MRIIARAAEEAQQHRMRFMQALQKNHLNRWQTATPTAPSTACTELRGNGNGSEAAATAAMAAFATLIAYAINLVN